MVFTVRIIHLKVFFVSLSSRNALNVAIPTNAKAEVHLPRKSPFKTAMLNNKRVLKIWLTNDNNSRLLFVPQRIVCSLCRCSCFQKFIQSI